jgi:hypothetical protein
LALNAGFYGPVNQLLTADAQLKFHDLGEPCIHSMRYIKLGSGIMKISAAVFGIVLEITFIVYCIYMTYLLDILDPFPRDWMIPNILIGGAILIFGYFIASRLNRDETFTARKWSNNERK